MSDSMMEKVIELIALDYPVEKIAELTGYPIKDIKDTAKDWRNKMQTKGVEK